MKDIFKKCLDYTMADDVKKQGLYPYFHVLESKQGPEVVMEGKRKIMLGSNNYLGLTTNPEVQEAAIKAIEKYGTGCSGSRYLNGNLDIHVELEKELADFVGKEDAICFSTGYGSNLAILSCLAGRSDYYICDREDHSSIYDGCKLSFGGTMKRYKHSDMEDLEKVLKSVPEEAGAMIVTDGLFSMTGGYANLPEIVRLAKKYGAKVMVDDAHTFGTTKKGGRGAAWHFGLQNDVDIFMGTFSKSLASLGGFVASSERVVNYIRHNSRPFIFTASATPSSTAAALAALRYLKAHPQLPEHLQDLAKYMRECLKKKGVITNLGEGPVISLPIRSTQKTLLVNKKLYDSGVYANCAFPPAVDENESLIRLSLMATLTKPLIDEATDIIAKVMKEFY